MLSQNEITNSFAEDLLKQFGNEEMDIKDVKLIERIQPEVMNNNNNNMQTRNLKSPSIKCEVTSTSVLLKKHEIKTEPVIKIENILEYDCKPKFTIRMGAKDVEAAVK